MAKAANFKKIRSTFVAVDPAFSLHGIQTAARMQNEQLSCKIDTAMWIQQYIIDLGDRTVGNKRIQLLFIFLQSGLALIFNTYNLAVFLVRFLLKGPTGVSALVAFAFYGYHILCAAHHTLITIVYFSRTYDEISSAARIVNRLSIYVNDDAVRLRLLQFSQLCVVNLRKYTIFGLYSLNGSFITSIVSGTLTYIVILVQYGDTNDVFLDSSNKTLHHAK